MMLRPHSLWQSLLASSQFTRLLFVAASSPLGRSLPILGRTSAFIVTLGSQHGSCATFLGARYYPDRLALFVMGWHCYPLSTLSAPVGNRLSLLGRCRAFLCSNPCPLDLPVLLLLCG